MNPLSLADVRNFWLAENRHPSKRLGQNFLVDANIVRIILEAAGELDPDKRIELYTRSDEILINEAAIITPVYYYGGPFLRKLNVKAPITVTGYDRWEKWTIE